MLCEVVIYVEHVVYILILQVYKKNALNIIFTGMQPHNGAQVGIFVGKPLKSELNSMKIIHGDGEIMWSVFFVTFINFGQCYIDYT